MRNGLSAADDELRFERPYIEGIGVVVDGGEALFLVEAEVHHRGIVIQVAIALFEPFEVAVDVLKPAVGLRQLAGAPPQRLLGADALGDVDEVAAQLDGSAAAADR